MAHHEFADDGKCRYCGCGSTGTWKPFVEKPCPNAPSQKSDKAATKLRRAVRQRQLNHGVLNALGALLEELRAGVRKLPPGVKAEEIQMAFEWIQWERQARGEPKPDGHKPGR